MPPPCRPEAILCPTVIAGQSAGGDSGQDGEKWALCGTQTSGPSKDTEGRALCLSSQGKGGRVKDKADTHPWPSALSALPLAASYPPYSHTGLLLGCGVSFTPGLIASSRTATYIQPSPHPSGQQAPWSERCPAQGESYCAGDPGGETGSGLARPKGRRREQCQDPSSLMGIPGP